MDLGKLASTALDLGVSMNAGSQNLFNQQSPLAPGRIITKVKRYVSPTGQVVELQWVTITVQDNQGIFRTEEIIEVVPPLQDSITPNDCDEIRECFRCKSLIHISNAYICPSCSQCNCLPCTVNFEVEGKQIRICVTCAKEVRTPLFLRIIKKAVWGNNV